MNKRVLKIVLLLVCAALLVCAYFLVSRLSDGEAEETTAPPAATHTVAKVDLNTVYQFGYTYEGKEYAFRLNEAEDGWVWDGDSTLPISNTKVAMMLTYFSEMKATISIDNLTSDKISEYGLDAPALEMFFKDGKGLHTFKVGIVNPYNSLAYIMSSTNESVAYMVASEFIDEFSCTIDGMLQIEGTDPFSLNESATVTLEKGDEKLVYTYYPSGKSNYISSNCNWFLSINGGEEFPINEELGAELSSALKASVFAEIITYDKEKYAQYGLADNSLKVTVSGTNVTVSTDSSTGEQTETKKPCTFSFYLGDTDKDGYSYGITDNSPLLYLTTSSVYDELYSFDRDNYASICSAYIWNIDSSDITEFSLTYGGKDYVFVISESATGVTCTLNGNAVSYDKISALLKAVSMLAWDNDVSKVTESGSKDTLLSITVKADELSASASFSSYSDEYCRITHGDRSEFLILKSNLDKIVSLLGDIAK